MRYVHLKTFLEEPPPLDNNTFLLGDSIRVEALQTLKEDVKSCFNGAFYLKLEEVETVYSQKRDPKFARFFDVIIRRLKRLTSVHA